MSEKEKLLFEVTDFSYMDNPQRQWCEELQAKMIELSPTKEWADTDLLWLAASEALGNKDERYCGIYVCESCGHLYHRDYSTNPSTKHDFCGVECEADYKAIARRN